MHKVESGAKFRWEKNLSLPKPLCLAHLFVGLKVDRSLVFFLIKYLSRVRFYAERTSDLLY